MWKAFSRILLRNKLAFTIGLLLVTAFMGYETTRIELSYEFAQILPKDDSTFIAYQQFKNKFGEDGSVMVIGFEDKNLYQLQKFNDWDALGKRIKSIDGIKEIMSVSTIYNVSRNDSLGKFDFVPILKNPLKTQHEVDSIRDVIMSLPFYEGIIYNKETGANLMAITFNKKDLDSKHRLSMVKEITEVADAFAKKNQVQMHYSGMPYIRSAFMGRVSSEMGLFLGLAVLVTAIILWLFFRTFSTVIFSVIVVAVGVLWSVGILQLFGYKITVLTGLIPPLIMVIGLPNCIFLINKYQSEFALHGNKMKALSRTIQTIGVSLFLANITTAIGFAVLYFTNSSLLVQFGVVAAIGVMTTYFITLILIPIILNILPEPKAKHMKHLEGKRINKLLDVVDNLVHHHRMTVYITIAVITLISVWGMTKVDVVGYVVDDLPQKDPVYTDLRFFESNFKGVLPFEISIDTKKENGLFANNAKALYKIKALQKIFAEHPEFSKPLSIVEAVKFSYQAYKGGDPKYYKLPGVSDLKTLSEYSGSVKGQGSKLQNFIDSTKQITRVSFQVADIGSKKMKVLVGELKPKIDSIFNPAEYDVKLTGHSLVFLKNNDYLLSNLYESLIIEIILIAIVGIALFRSVRIIVLSKLPCLIPLIITAGVMGFLDIRFKPSTILIFSIAFGISSDGTIYFLTKYRQELKKGKSAGDAISMAIKDTGLSMIYTAVILFFGFIIFAASSFGGTVALGVLVSLTLIVSMCTNLLMLPSILLSINNRALKKEMLQKPFVELEDESEEENEADRP
ncbi:MAG: MMPL family transporter [Bacteroidetes bacterium]|nr:MMPL family transporter [Bacteroidota bacterium]